MIIGFGLLFHILGFAYLVSDCYKASFLDILMSRLKDFAFLWLQMLYWLLHNLFNCFVACHPYNQLGSNTTKESP